MAFKATKYFVLIVALVIGGTRYMNTNQKRINFNDDVGVWDTKTKDGMRYTIMKRSNETGGEYVRVHVYCTPKGSGFFPGKPCSPPMHIHDVQDEAFQVISGVLTLDINGTETLLTAGQKQLVPSGLPHTFWNAAAEPVEFTFTLTPGTPDEGFFETLYGLAQEHEGLDKVNPIQLLLLFAEQRVTLTDVPPPLWAAAKTVLVPLGHAMGFKARYPEYTARTYEAVQAGAQEGEQEGAQALQAEEAGDAAVA